MWPSPAGGINPYVRIIRDDARTSRTTAIDPPKELMREIHLEYARWNYVRNYFRYLPRGACKFYSQSLFLLFSAFVLLSHICLFPRVRYFIRVANLVVFTTLLRSALFIILFAITTRAGRIRPAVRRSSLIDFPSRYVCIYGTASPMRVKLRLASFLSFFLIEQFYISRNRSPLV